MRFRWAVRWSVMAMALAAVLVTQTSPAAAHTAFESSVPADGDVVDVVVSEVVIRFTGEARPTGEGFTVLDPTGVVRSPSSVTTDDNRVFVLAFEPPLAGGPVGVRWVVQAQDAHPIDGSFSFTVTAPPPTTTPPTTTAPTTTAAAESTAAPETTAAPESVPTTTMATDHEGEAAGVSLDEFLAAETSTPGESRQLVGRVGTYLGVIGAVGGLAFLGFTLRGTRREIDGVLVAVAGLGVLTAIGAGFEYWGWLAQIDGSFFGELTSTPGLAMALRFAGGTIIAGSIVATRRPPTIETAPSDVSAVSLRRWDPRTAPLTLAGGALSVGSFWFDGHTVSEGPRVVHAAVNSVHVVAAAVWAAGVAALLSVLVARRRRGEPSRAAELVVRFSSIAAVSATATVLAGAAMAAIVLDGPGELTSTEWGRVLVLKTAAVGVAVVAGAYNHVRLRPRLAAAPDDPRLETELRTTLIAETVALTSVVVATAWLVAAAT